MMSHFETINAALAEVDAHSPDSSRQFFARIADQTLAITSPDDALLTLHTNALKHAAISDVSRVDLSIFVVDGTHLDLWPSAERLFSTQLADAADIVSHDPVYFQRGKEVSAMVRPRHGTLTVLDERSGRAVVWYRDRGSISQRDRTKPFRTLLYWWLRGRVGQVLHAAAVGTSEGGVLITGNSGAGKSTISLACLRSDLRFAGDDHVLVGDDPLTVFCLYSSAIVAHDHQQRHFPHLKLDPDLRSEAGSPKAATYLSGEETIASVPLRAILLPAVHDGPAVTIEPVSPGAALAALAPASIMQLPGAGPDDFRWMANLIRRVPVYTLRFGSDLSRVPQAIMRLLNEEIKEVTR